MGFTDIQIYATGTKKQCRELVRLDYFIIKCIASIYYFSKEETKMRTGKHKIEELRILHKPCFYYDVQKKSNSSSRRDIIKSKCRTDFSFISRIKL